MSYRSYPASEVWAVSGSAQAGAPRLVTGVMGAFYHYCAWRTAALDAGHYCVAGAATVCPSEFYCPADATAALPCPAGTCIAAASLVVAAHLCHCTFAGARAPRYAPWYGRRRVLGVSSRRLEHWRRHWTSQLHGLPARLRADWAVHGLWSRDVRWRRLHRVCSGLRVWHRHLQLACSACLANYWLSSPSCNACPYNSVSAGGTSASCQCAVGQQWVASSGCSACPQGRYQSKPSSRASR